MTIQEMFKEAIELRNKGKLEEAIHQFLSIIKAYPTDPKISGVYATLAGIYSDLEDYEKAYINFKEASRLNPKSELASLGLYISLVELGKDEEAIIEMKRYLASYPADLYKTTLEELLEGLEKGFMVAHRELITSLAEKNRI
jgi:tetratricopeptide (TPR) repeat protein